MIAHTPRHYAIDDGHRMIIGTATPRGSAPVQADSRLNAKTNGRLTQTQRWLSADDLARIYTSQYWNDIEAEKHKEWWIEDGEYDRCRRYLQRSRLLEEYQQAEKFILQLPGQNLRIADLAAGIGWTSALLSRITNVSEVHAVEISEHRIERLFPHCMVMFDGCWEKVRRYLGSFYDLKLAKGSMDVIFLSQAFHHADRPLHLMSECDRVLRPGGRVVMVGEHVVGPLWFARRLIKTLILERRFTTRFHELFPADSLVGDHYYRLSDYEFLFSAMGYRASQCLARTGQYIFVGDKPA